MEKSRNEGTSKQRPNMGTMTMAPRGQAGAGISLPSLQETIPEFFSHHPSGFERNQYSMPRRFSERYSPGPSSAISDSSTGMTFKRRKLNPISPSRHREPTLTGVFPVTSASEPENHHIPQASSGYPFPSSSYRDVDRRRLSSISTGSQPESTYLPPVSTLGYSRGSSFELDSSERTPVSQSLPSMFSHTPLPAHSSASYESDRGRSYPSQDYHYNNPPASHRMYHSTSPSSQQPGLPPSRATQSYPSMRAGCIAPGPSSHLDHSTLSHSGQLSRLEMGMDHQYQQDPRHGKRRRGNLPKHVTDILRQWLNEHLAHPYPTEEEKNHLMNVTGLTMNQISNWFINARRRRLPPRTDDSRNGSNNQAVSPRAIGGLLPYPPNTSR